VSDETEVSQRVTPVFPRRYAHHPLPSRSCSHRPAPLASSQTVVDPWRLQTVGCHPLERRKVRSVAVPGGFGQWVTVVRVLAPTFDDELVDPTAKNHTDGGPRRLETRLQPSLGSCQPKLPNHTIASWV
jgi:hypothetical protein